MKEILDILIKAPISKLAEIDPKLAGHVIKAAGLDNKPKGTQYSQRGELIFFGDAATLDLMMKKGYTYDRLVAAGYAKWGEPNE